MGIRLSLILIEGQSTASPEQIAKTLGFSEVYTEGKTTLDTIIYPDENVMGIGYFGRCTLVVADHDLPFSVIESDMANNYYHWQDLLSEHFAGKEMIAAFLQSTVNGYGFAYVDKEGRKVRTKLGDYEQSPMIETGEPIAAEEEYLKNSFINDGNERIYKLDSEEYTEDQIGESIVLTLIEQFSGEDSGLLWQTEVERFSVYK
jgi:hypothetical protein